MLLAQTSHNIPKGSAARQLVDDFLCVGQQVRGMSLAGLKGNSAMMADTAFVQPQIERDVRYKAFRNKSNMTDVGHHCPG